MQIRNIIKGLRCEKCSDERRFGHPPNTDSDNLFVYGDMCANTRCFCKKHMTFFSAGGKGGMTDYKEEGSVVGYGAVLVSEVLKKFDALCTKDDEVKG